MSRISCRLPPQLTGYAPLCDNDACTARPRKVAYMARYVLLEFDDNASAKRFVQGVNEDYAAVLPDYKTRRCIAVWAKPTLFCECTRGVKGMNPFRRGVKSGWWVHAPCGRPTRAWAKGNHWFSAIGRNLLPGNTDYVPMGWGLLNDKDASGAAIIPTGKGGGNDPMPVEQDERKKARREARRELKRAQRDTR